MNTASTAPALALARFESHLAALLGAALDRLLLGVDERDRLLGVEFAALPEAARRPLTAGTDPEAEDFGRIEVAVGRYGRGHTIREAQVLRLVDALATIGSGTDARTDPRRIELQGAFERAFTGPK